jgi:hypothetical protein
MRRRLDKKAKSDHPDFWVGFLREELRDKEGESFIYGWLRSAMHENEVEACRKAAEELGLTLTIDRKGCGSVIRTVQSGS